MENKYYVPFIEEFHYGFEFERNEAHRVYYKPDMPVEYKWVSKKWDEHQIRLGNLKCEIFGKNIRVKHLTVEDIKSLGFVEYDTSKESAVESLCRKNGPIEVTYHHPNKLSLKKHKDTEEYQNYYYLSYTCEIIHPITSEKKLRGFEYNGVIRNKSELKQLINNLKRTS